MRFATLLSTVALAMLVSGRPSVTSSSHSIAKRNSTPHDLRARARIETAKEPKRDTTITSSNFVEYRSSLDDDLSSDTVSDNAVSYSDDLSSYSAYSTTGYFSDPVSTDFTASTGSNPSSSGESVNRPDSQSEVVTDGIVPTDTSIGTDPNLNRMVVRRRSSATVDYKYPTGLDYDTDLKRKDVIDVSRSAEYDPSLFRRDDNHTSDNGSTSDLDGDDSADTLDGNNSTDAVRAAERRRTRLAPVDRTSAQGSRLPREETHDVSYSLDYDPFAFDRRASLISGILRSRLHRKQVESTACVDGLGRHQSVDDDGTESTEYDNHEDSGDDGDAPEDGDNQDEGDAERRQSDEGGDDDFNDHAAKDDVATDDEITEDGVNKDTDDISRLSGDTEEGDGEADGGDDTSDGEHDTQPSDDGGALASDSAVGQEDEGSTYPPQGVDEEDGSDDNAAEDA